MPPKQISRPPLSNIPNALNSPVRPTAAKRARPDGKPFFEDTAAPPSKRQQLDLHRDSQQERENIPPHPQTPQKRKPVSGLDHRLGHGGRSDAIDRERMYRQQLMIDKEQEKARERDGQRDKQRQLRTQKDAQQDEIAKWQRYYEKKFPEFVFFFENIPEDARRKCSKQVRQLGAREDRFFSRGLTHVVTTRPLPHEAITPIEEEQPQHQHNLRHGGTINPSLLDKRSKTIDELAGATRGKSVFDVALSRKAGLNGSPDKPKASKDGDVLQKAKELGIKIWQLEKLQRVLRVMFDDDNEPDYADMDSYQQNARAALTRAPRKQPEPLSKLIKREEQSKSSAHDLSSMLKTELVPLSEPYIFVRCMNERTKPLLVRQYNKVAKSTDGDWPQFRPVTQGKCPFIIEEKSRRSEKTAARAEKAQQAIEKAQHQEQRVTRAHAAEVCEQEQQKECRIESTQSHHFEQRQKLQPYESARGAPLATLDQPPQPTTHTAPKRHDTPTIHEENEENLERDEDVTEEDPAVADEDATTDAVQTTPTEGDFSKPCYDQGGHSRQTSFDMMAPPAPLPRPNPAVGRPGGEPLASGLQRSGATAAIRSTMGISSAAAQPGSKAGTTRDIHSLQRRVLDRYSTGGSGSTMGMSAPAVPPALQPSHHGLVESRRMVDIAGRARADNPRAAKMKAQEKIHEQHQPTTTTEYQRAMAQNSQQKREKDRQAAKAKREPKPGYCENCKDKFDDFEEHTKSRKHRKFATNKDNWAELDKLLALLIRPQKRKYQEDSSEGEDDIGSMTTEFHTVDRDRALDERAHKRTRLN